MYNKAFMLDGDPEVFDNLLKSCGLLLSDIGGMSIRSKQGTKSTPIV